MIHALNICRKPAACATANRVAARNALGMSKSRPRLQTRSNLLADRFCSHPGVVDSLVLSGKASEWHRLRKACKCSSYKHADLFNFTTNETAKILIPFIASAS